MRDTVDEGRLDELGLTGSETDVDLAGLPDDVLAAIAGALQVCMPDLGPRLTSVIASDIGDRATDTLPVTPEEATCVSDALVTGFGAPRLLVLDLQSGAAGFSLGAVGADDVGTVTDAFVGCVDLRTIVAEQFTKQGITADVAACIAREIPDQNLRTLFAAQFTGDQVDPETLLGPALTACDPTAASD